MCFYDAELLRLRAHTHTDPTPAEPTSAPPLTWPASQGATLFELRAALDDFELCGQPARAPSPTPSAGSPPTAAGRNWHGPRPP